MSGNRSRNGSIRAIASVLQPAQSSVRIFVSAAASDSLFAGSLTLTQNVALKKAIADYLDKRPNLKQLQQIALEHRSLEQENKSLELAIRLREEEIARMLQATPGNPAAASAGLLKPAPEEVKAWLQRLGLEQYFDVLIDNG